MYLPSGEIFISLLKGEHSPYWGEETQAGAIAIVDAATLTISNVFDIDRDPYDIAVDRSGFIYIAGGSAQWTVCGSYISRWLRFALSWRLPYEYKHENLSRW